MKKIISIILLHFLIFSGLRAQQFTSNIEEYKATKKYPQVYGGSALEFIFSMADIKIDNPNVRVDPVLRFTLILNSQNRMNYDLSKNFGIISGFDIRNIGYTYKTITDNGLNKEDSCYKVRTYNLGIPLGFKIGDLEKDFFFFGGAEIEWAFHYKRKRFLGTDKKLSVQTKWFPTDGGPVNIFMPSYFAGVTFPYGTTVQFRYYPQNFINPNFYDSDYGYKPYEGMTAYVYYIGFSFNLFHKNKPAYKYEYHNSKSENLTRR